MPGVRLRTAPTGSTSARPTSSTSAAPSRAPNRAGRTSSHAPTATRWPTPAGPRARTSATRSGPPAGVRPWAARTAMNRGQVLYRVAELMEGRRDQFVAEVAAAEGLSAAARANQRRPRDRSLGLVRRLGRQDQPGARLVQPGRRAVLQLHHPRGDRRRRPGRARSRARCSASSAAWRRPSWPATSLVVLASETRPLPAVTLGEVLATSDVPAA